MADAELHLQFQGDTILAVLGMIGRYTPDELDVLSRNGRPAGSPLGFIPPELPKLSLPPADHGLGDSR